MCPGGDCPNKSNCYRHTAKPSLMQTYFEVPPYDENSIELCDFYWPIKSPSEKKRLDSLLE